MPPRTSQRRRLQRIGLELKAVPTAESTVSSLLARDIDNERRRIATQNANREKGLTASDWEKLGLPFPVLDVVDGAIPHGQLREVEDLRDTAAARHAFREAALHQDLLTCLGPQQQAGTTASRLSECFALRSTEERARFFLTNGFCVINLKNKNAGVTKLKVA